MNKPTSKKSTSGLRTWLEIDRKALKNNYQTFRKIIPKKTQLMSVVKSNAYGHGLNDFSQEMEKLGIDWFGVDSAVEALSLRRKGIKKPILILGHTLPEMVEEVTKNKISLTISSFEALENLKKINSKEKAKVHIKVDTGMGRQGFLLKDLQKVLSKVKSLESKIEIEGLYTHFAAAKNPAFPKYTLGQIDEFKEWAEVFKKAGYKPINHAAASSGTLIFLQSHFDMVRVGVSMYGLWPSPEVEAYCKDKYKLVPILSWKTVIGEVKTLKKGSQVGYDLTEELQKDSQVAICPIGYWHGFNRAFSSIGRVLVKGQRAKVLGRVSMDMIIIDVSGIKGVKVGDEVVVLGKQGKEEVTADELAHLAGTINYEIVTRINPLIKKLYI